ncbi:(2Fe-2S)-binding protein [Salinisphaera sp. Q1T1-3]
MIRRCGSSCCFHYRTPPRTLCHARTTRTTICRRP